VTDIMARILADETSKRWGQQVIVENRPGIAGTLGVAKAVADGTTLMLTSNGHTVAGLVNKNLPFDPVKDFAGITRVSSAPLYLIINPEVAAKNLKELIELAKAKPGTLNFSSPGPASTTFIAGALFRKAAGINIVHVPFKSAPDAVTATLQGDMSLLGVLGADRELPVSADRLGRPSVLRHRFRQGQRLGADADHRCQGRQGRDSCVGSR
jgi:tripartite-type tricarboxylate transporter receptor subunit TctC